MNTQKKYHIGLVIGRFQPLHLGHIYLLNKSLELCEKIIIGIGSSNITDQDNVFSYNERLKMIELFIKEEKIENRVRATVAIPDVPDDEKWYELVLERAGKFDVVLGQNEWVNEIFENKGYKIERIEYHDRVNLEGKKIRELINSNQKWDDRVTKYVRDIINST